MEEYQKKVNYLRHIKNIADIQEGHRKPTTLSSIFHQSHTRTFKFTQDSISKVLCPQSMFQAKLQDN